MSSSTNGSIDVDPTAFRSDGDSSGETVIVVGAPSGAVVDALTASATRFMLVDELGHEYTSEEYDNLPEVAAGEELYTPNYVSNPTPVDGGLSLYVDCKGEIAEPMRRTFIAILVEELERRHVSQARVYSPSGT